VNQLTRELTKDVQLLVGKILSLEAIPGGITNRNYKLEASSGTYMIRVPGERTELLGIDRKCEFECSHIAYSVGIGAQPVAYLQMHGALFTRYLENAETLTAARAKTQLAAILSALKKIHAAPAFPKSFSAFETIRQYHQLALEHRVEFPTDTAHILEQLVLIEQTLEPHAVIVPCHNDLLPANILLTDQLWIVDWEYAGNGNAVFDLGNLAANLELNETELQALIAQYYGETNPNLEAQVQLMRLVSDAREAFWGYLQSGISSLEFDFISYSAKHLDRFRNGITRAEYSLWLRILQTQQN
jgi:thiamine kinase-like enzyme